MTDTATKARHAILERAADNFVLLPPVTIGRKDMIVTLPGSVQDQLIEQFNELKKSDNMLAETGGLDFRVKLFGESNHQVFKRMVLRPHAAVRTYCDKIGTPTARKIRGRCVASDRLLPAGMLLEWMKESERLANEAKVSKQAFAPHYNECLEAGRAAVDHNLPFTVSWKGREVPVSEVVRDMSPSLDEFMDSFYIELPVPKRLTPTDFSGLSIPADKADQWNAAELERVETQIDNAKERLIEDSLKLVKRVSTQLSKTDGRIFDTLITEAQAVSESLKGLVEGYDPADLQLRNAAVAIQEKIGSVPDTETWRTNMEARRESIRAAQAAEKVLKSSAKRLKKKLDGPKPDTGTLLEGGMLGDIL